MNNTLSYSNTQRLLFPLKFSFLVNVRFLAALGIILIISFLAFYIFQITNVISKGYQVQNYQEKITELAEQNKILEINSAKINSLENIDSQIQNLGFERVDKIHYIQLLEGSVVTANKKTE